MLLISNFKDYYDHAISYGVDKKVVYNRKEVILKDQVIELFDNLEQDQHCNRMGVFLICGKVFPFYHLRRWVAKGNDETYVGEIDPRCIFKDTVDDVQDCFNIIRNDLGLYVENNLIVYDNSFKSIPNDKLLGLNIKYGSPVLKITRVSSNPNRYQVTSDIDCLRDYGFSKRYNATQLFQDISQFIATVHTPDLYDLNDKEKHSKHGFDKYSFRKRKD